MPLGRPVEPDEYIQKAMSSEPVSAQANSSDSPSMNADSGTMPGITSEPLTMTTRSTLVPSSVSASKLGASDASQTARVAFESSRK